MRPKEISPDMELVVSAISTTLDGRQPAPEFISNAAPHWRDILPGHRITIEHIPRPPKGSKPRPRAYYLISIVGDRVNGRCSLSPSELMTLAARSKS